MAIALVKSGTLSTAAATTITPAFGQATAAGNLLIAFVAAQGANTITTSSSGWTVLPPMVEGVVSSAIAYKPNSSASETAPTFASTSATNMAAVLSEWSGAATSSPTDQTAGTSTGGIAPITFLNAAANGTDRGPSDLYVANFAYVKGSGSNTTLTLSNSFTPSGGTSGTIAQNPTTSGHFWMSAVYYLLNGSGGGTADAIQQNVTVGNGSVSGAAAAWSFLPATSTQSTWTSSGYWMAPSGTTAVTASCWGGGGGGGGGGSTGYGGGGGGGGFARSTLAAIAGNYYIVTVGAGGTGGGNNTAGGNGGDSWFATSTTVKGALGGGGGAGGTAGGSQGNAGNTNTGTTTWNGGNGAAGGATAPAGGGGGGAGSGGGAGNASGGTGGGGGIDGGQGGGGSGGNGGSSAANGVAGNSVAGAGGGGGASISTPGSGGAGAAGKVLLVPVLAVAQPQLVLQAVNRSNTF